MADPNGSDLKIRDTDTPLPFDAHTNEPGKGPTASTLRPLFDQVPPLPVCAIYSGAGV